LPLTDPGPLDGVFEMMTAPPPSSCWTMVEPLKKLM